RDDDNDADHDEHFDKREAARDLSLESRSYAMQRSVYHAKRGSGIPQIVMNHTISVLKTRKGPNGTSLFIVICSEPDRRRLRGIRSHPEMTAPITNARKPATMPLSAPSSQPMPSASFGSPSPIHFPLETSHRKKSGAAAIGPARSTRGTLMLGSR